MKKILLILFLFGAYFVADAQYTGYTNINSRYNWLAGLFSSLGAPAGGNASFAAGQAHRAGALYYDSTGVDSGFYVYTGTQWFNLSQGGSTPTLAVVTGAGNETTTALRIVKTLGGLEYASLKPDAPNDQGALLLEDATLFKTTEYKIDSIIYNDSILRFPHKTGTLALLSDIAGNTLASQGNQKSGDTVVFAGPIGTPGIFTNERTINTNRLIMHWTNGIPAEAGGAYWQFTQRPYSPYQFISQDTVSVNDALPTYGRPLSGIFARRVLYFNPTIYKAQQVYGHYLGQTYSWADSVVVRNDGMDYGEAAVIENRYKPRNSGYQVIRFANGTGNDARKLHATPSLVVNANYDPVDNASTDTLRGRGVTAGIISYLLANSSVGKIRADEHVYFQAGNLVTATAHFNRTTVLARQTNETQVDTSYFLWDTLRTSRSMLNNVVVGFGDSTQSGAQFKVYGSSLHTGWSGYWSNVAANYTARSFTDKNYVDSSLAALSPTVPNNSITNAKLAQMAAHTFKGNNTGSTTDALDLTATQLTAEINDMVGDAGSGGTKGAVPAPAAGDAAALKFLKADGTWAIPAGSGSGADVALSNLSGVAINTSLVSDADNTDDLGTSAKGWKDAYIRRTLMKGSTSGTAEIKSDALANTMNGVTLSGTGYVGATMFAVERSDFTGSNVNTVQPVFSTGNDVWTLQASTTYEVEGFYYFTHGATSHALGISFELAGGASVTSVALWCYAQVVAAGTVSSAQTSNLMLVTTNTALTVAAANGLEIVSVKGYITMNAGGTITPSYTMTAAPGGTVLTKAGSYIKFTPIGTNTVTSLGNVN